MRNAKKSGLLCLFCAALVIPGLAQESRRPPERGNAEERRIPGELRPETSSPSSIANRGIAAGQTGDPVPSASSAGRNVAYAAPSRGSYAPPAPNIERTSFRTVGRYYEWQDYFRALRMQYLMSGAYFARFFRNTEPLITPQLMSLTARRPLSLSVQMLAALDDLEALVLDLQAGRQIDKREVSEKAKEIRELAKKIRSDESLSFVDRRADRNLAREGNFDDLGLEGIRQLRELVVDMNVQLSGMHSLQSTSTVSIEHLQQPSFESLSKGIEKLTKVIESSAKRI